LLYYERGRNIFVVGEGGVTFFGLLSRTGVYIMENTPPWGGGGNISRCHLGEKNMKRPREKGGKCGRKRKKGERKRKKGERKLEKRKQKGKRNAK
jgi:hypothetical protein